MTRIALLILLALGSDASADTSSKAKADATAAYADGQRRYLAEDYDGAARQFLAAYTLDPDPAYLFNIAQAYRFAKQCAKSARYYRRFLAVARNPPNKTDVVKYIAEQDVCAKTQPPLPPDPEPDPKPDPEPDLKPNPKPDPVVVTPPREAPKPTTQDPGQLRKRLALGAFAIGAIGAGAGIVFASRIESLESKRERLCKDVEPGMPCEGFLMQDLALRDDADSASKAMITSFAVGGVAIGAGLFLYITGRHRSEQVAVAPTQGGAIVSLTLTR